MKNTVKIAFKTSIPVIFGYLAASFIFGLMLTSAGFHAAVAIIMSIVMYAGAGQYLAVGLLTSGASFLQIGVSTFLINSKHLFYGLSLLKDYKNVGIKKLYLIFSLTDETYAILTSGIHNPEIDRTSFCFYVSLFNHLGWIPGTAIGALVGSVFIFDTTGMDFAMTALFIVIIIGQWQFYKTKLPFIIGAISAIAACLIFGKSNMLLISSILSVVILILTRKKIEQNDN